jgi:hypothetical protein
MAKKNKNPASNCGVAVKTVYEKGIVDNATYVAMMNVHEEGCEAKHTGWSAGYNFSYQAIDALHTQGIVDDEVFNALKQINADGNSGKHWK